MDFIKILTHNKHMKIGGERKVELWYFSDRKLCYYWRFNCLRQLAVLL